MPYQDAHGTWISDDGLHFHDGTDWRPLPPAAAAPTPGPVLRFGQGTMQLVGTEIVAQSAGRGWQNEDRIPLHQVERIEVQHESRGKATLSLRMMTGLPRAYRGCAQPEAQLFAEHVGEVQGIRVQATDPRADFRAGKTSMQREVIVRSYRSDKEFQKDAETMYAKGFEMQGQTSRTKNWRIATGFLTNKGITQVTWVKKG